MQRVTIKSDAFEVRTGTGKNGPWEMREQTGYIETGHDFPDRFKINLDKDQRPYPPGEYYLENPLVVGEYLGLTVARRIVLKPIPRPAVPQAK